MHSYAVQASISGCHYDQRCQEISNSAHVVWEDYLRNGRCAMCAHFFDGPLPWYLLQFWRVCVWSFFSWRNSYMMGSSARMVALCSVLKKNQEWKRSYSTFGFSHIIMRQTCNFYSLLHALMFSWRNIYKGKLLLLLRGFRKFCSFLERQHCTPHPKNDGRKNIISTQLSSSREAYMEFLLPI